MVYKHDGQKNFDFINSRCEYALCLDVEDAELQPQVDIATFANQCEKTYAEHVEGAYMMESELPKDFSVGTAKTSEQQITNRRNTRTLVRRNPCRPEWKLSIGQRTILTKWIVYP